MMSWNAKSGVIVLIVLVLSTGLSLGLGKGDRKKKRTSTYEYSAMIIVTIEGESRSVYRSCAGEEEQEVMARDMDELCKKMGLPGKGGITRFMNYLGSKGWLLIDIDWEKYPEGTAHTYHFRRLR